MNGIYTYIWLKFKEHVAHSNEGVDTKYKRIDQIFGSYRIRRSRCKNPPICMATVQPAMVFSWKKGKLSMSSTPTPERKICSIQVKRNVIWKSVPLWIYLRCFVLFFVRCSCSPILVPKTSRSGKSMCVKNKQKITVMAYWDMLNMFFLAQKKCWPTFTDLGAAKQTKKNLPTTCTCAPQM